MPVARNSLPNLIQDLSDHVVLSSDLGQDYGLSWFSTVV
jgi:hypothetical protein